MCGMEIQIIAIINIAIGAIIGGIISFVITKMFSDKTDDTIIRVGNHIILIDQRNNMDPIFDEDKFISKYKEHTHFLRIMKEFMILKLRYLKISKEWSFEKQQEELKKMPDLYWNLIIKYNLVQKR